MYLCIASGNNSSMELAKVISEANQTISAIQKLIAELHTVPENLIDLNNFASIYIYGFQGVISHLSDAILNVFQQKYNLYNY